MKKFVSVFLILLSFYSFSQDAKQFKVVFYKEVTFETPDYKLYLVRCFTRENELKIKIRIFNKTKDYIYIKPGEIEINIQGEILKTDSKPVIVQPDGDEAKLMDYIGKQDLRCDNFEVVLNGFYKIPVDGDVYLMQNTPLPEKIGTEITAGDINCTLKDVDVTAKKAFAKFNCIYNGDKVAIIDASKCQAEMANGNKVNNAVQSSMSFVKTEGQILEKGEAKDIKLDYKFNNTGKFNDGMGVKWNHTFTQSNKMAYKVIKVPMQLDLDKSEK